MATEIKKYDINSIKDAYNTYLTNFKDSEDRTASNNFSTLSTKLETLKSEHKKNLQCIWKRAKSKRF